MTFKDKLLLFIKGSSGESSNTTTVPKVKKVREKKITRLHLILAGIVFITVLTVFIVIRVKISNKERMYVRYEKELVNAADLYYELKGLKIKDGTAEIINIKKLKIENLINTDNKLVNKCVGCVESTSEKDYNEDKYKVTRKAYIKCGNKYKTINYACD